MIERLEGHSSITIAGHRGYPSAYPENTLLSFEKALEAGVDMLELDLHLSMDNILMVIHDDTVDRTTNGSGKVSHYTAAELKRLDAGLSFGAEFKGLSIPTFAEFCKLLEQYPDTLLNVEIKSSPNAKDAADQAIAMLGEYDYLTRCVFTSFDATIVAHIHDHYGLKTQGFLGEVMHNFVPGRNGTYSKMWAIAFRMNLLTPAIVKQFQDIGLLAWCYCPDDERQVHYALGCGVTLMTCNNPHPALKLSRQFNETLI